MGLGLVSLVYIPHGKGEGHVMHAGVNCICNVCGSTHSSGCVVNGYRAAFLSLYIISTYVYTYVSQCHGILHHDVHKTSLILCLSLRQLSMLASTACGMCIQWNL